MQSPNSAETALLAVRVLPESERVVPDFHSFRQKAVHEIYLCRFKSYLELVVHYHLPFHALGSSFPMLGLRQGNQCERLLILVRNLWKLSRFHLKDSLTISPILLLLSHTSLKFVCVWISSMFSDGLGVLWIGSSDRPCIEKVINIKIPSDYFLCWLIRAGK